MPNPFADATGIQKRTMVLFFLVDGSSSMSGEKIGQLNHCIEEVLPELQAISADNADANLKIAVLEFSSGAKWITSAPVPIENYRWQNISAGGCTDLGEACEMLNEKMSRSAFLNAEAASGYLAPALFLFSDGEPTDNYKKGLNALRSNNWYKSAIKVAVAFGDDFNHGNLESFTGNKESVLVTHTPDQLKYWIRFITVTASRIGTKSSSTGTQSKEADFTEELKDAKSDAPADWEKAGEGW